MSETRELIQKYIVPRLREMGFNGSYPHFRRERDGRNELLTFQLDRHGSGAFVIEVGSVPMGNYATSRGEVIPADKLCVYDLHSQSRLRLGMLVENRDRWFEFKRKWYQWKWKPETLADEIIRMIEKHADRAFMQPDTKSS